MDIGEAESFDAGQKSEAISGSAGQNTVDLRFGKGLAL
jgi:hypothetical protein